MICLLIPPSLSIIDISQFFRNKVPTLQYREGASAVAVLNLLELVELLPGMLNVLVHNFLIQVPCPQTLISDLTRLLNTRIGFMFEATSCPSIRTQRFELQPRTDSQGQTA